MKQQEQVATLGPLDIAKAMFAVVVWGGSFIATKIALRELPPLVLVWARFSMGLPVLAAFVIARGQMARVQPQRGIGYFLLLGFLGIAFHQWLQSTGLKTSAATTTAWIITATPVFIALLGRIALSETLRKLQLSGIILAAAGVLLVVSKGSPSSLLSGSFGEPGDILILLSSLNWAVFSVISRAGLKTYPPALMMLYVMIAGVLMITPFAVANPELNRLRGLSAAGWTALVFLGPFCSGFAYIFWYDALKKIPAARVGVFLYVEPLVAAVVAFYLLDEPLLWSTFAGGAAILTGVYLVNRK